MPTKRETAIKEGMELPLLLSFLLVLSSILVLIAYAWHQGLLARMWKRFMEKLRELDGKYHTKEFVWWLDSSFVNACASIGKNILAWPRARIHTYVSNKIYTHGGNT